MKRWELEQAIVHNFLYALRSEPESVGKQLVQVERKEVCTEARRKQREKKDEWLNG